MEILYVLFRRNCEVEVYELQQLHLHQIQLLQRYPAISAHFTVTNRGIRVALSNDQATGHEQSTRTGSEAYLALTSRWIAYLQSIRPICNVLVTTSFP